MALLVLLKVLRSNVNYKNYRLIFSAYILFANKFFHIMVERGYILWKKVIFIGKIIRLIVIDYLILKMLTIIPLALVVIPLLGCAVIFNINQINEIKAEKAEKQAKKETENSKS